MAQMKAEKISVSYHVSFTQTWQPIFVKWLTKGKSENWIFANSLGFSCNFVNFVPMDGLLRAIRF